jgi:hypothetical protein
LTFTCEMSEECSASYKASDTGRVTGRNWRVMWSHPSTPYLKFVTHSSAEFRSAQMLKLKNSKNFPNLTYVTNPYFCVHQMSTSNKLRKEYFCTLKYCIHLWDTYTFCMKSSKWKITVVLTMRRFEVTSHKFKADKSIFK